MKSSIEHLKQRLDGALARKDFYLHFQPLWRLDNLSCPIGTEVLLRWRDAELGPITPDVFIPLLEESGGIGAVGRWVIEQAVTTLADRRAALPEDFFISVNVSPVQLMMDDSLTGYIRQTLTRHALPIEAIELEITETARIYCLPRLAEKIRVLHRAGICIALDDFGTGFSSLCHLQQLPFDLLKIDRSFIGTLPDSTIGKAIVGAMLRLCRELGREVCAEGIETREQLGWLQHLGCARGQGFLLGKPEPELTARIITAGTSV